MTTKCIKVALDYSKDNKINFKEMSKLLFDIKYKTWLACNRAMTYYYTNDMQFLIQKDLGIPKESDKELYGKSFAAFVEQKMKEIMDICNTNNVAQTRQFVSNRYGNDKKQGLLKGNVTISQFKNSIPIIIHNRVYNIIQTPKGLAVEISLFNLAKQHELDIKKVIFNIPKVDGSSKEILTRLMNKEYKLGSGQLSYNQRKKKWMLVISFTFENKKEIKKNDDLVMGIDLGITKVATISIFNTKLEKFVKTSIKESMIDGTELIHYRQKIEARRKSAYIASKWASANNVGRGYKARTELANKIGDKYSRFRETYNHKISRYIVDMAVKYKVACIQMEDLSGFSEAQSESLLKNWSYYDLQNKIKYKAAEHGIEVVFINPQYTSKRCNVCGCIATENRDCKNNQAKFKCVCCGHENNADINASRNIAIPNIENIIKDCLKEKDIKTEEEVNDTYILA